MLDLRLGDVIDDYCIKCRRLTNHSIVSLMSGAAAKVRCRTCYSDHDYRNEQAPPTKKELARQKELYNAVLAGVAPAGVSSDPVLEPEIESANEAPIESGESIESDDGAAAKKKKK